MGSEGLARGYEFSRIGAELFWPDFAVRNSWGMAAVGYDGEVGDEGEWARRGAGVKRPEVQQTGGVAGRHPAGGGVVPSLQVMGWG